MAIIVEKLNRSGHVLELHKVESTLVSVGRGFDQSFIVEDPFVDPAHFQIQLDAETNTLKCVDLGSINGVYVEPQVGKKTAVCGVASLNSGDVVIAGRTRFRICHSQHHVAPAQALTPWHRVAYMLSVWPVVGLLFVVVAALSVFESYLQLPVTDSVRRYVLESSYVVLAVFTYGVFWASIGRALKGDGRLVAQLLLGCTGVILLSALGFVTPWLAYHLPGQQAWMYATKALVGCICFYILYHSVHTATRFAKLGALLIAAIAPLAIALNLLMTKLEIGDDIKGVPYQRTLIQPTMNIRPSVSSDEFINDANTIYQSFDGIQSK